MDRELYWIIKHGLKMTGMPAFGETHPEEQLWGIVAFLRRLPSLDARTYEQMVETIIDEQVVRAEVVVFSASM